MISRTSRGVSETVIRFLEYPYSTEAPEQTNSISGLFGGLIASSRSRGSYAPCRYRTCVRTYGSGSCRTISSTPHLSDEDPDEPEAAGDRDHDEVEHEAEETVRLASTTIGAHVE